MLYLENANFKYAGLLCVSAMGVSCKFTRRDLELEI